MVGKSLTEIEQELPNGFHDAGLERIDVCFLTGQVKLIFQLCLGDPDAETTEDRETYRRAALTLSGVIYFVVEPPEDGRDYFGPGPLRVDGGEAAKGLKAPKPFKPLPEDVFAYWIFVEHWNSFIHLAASSATLEWL